VKAKFVVITPFNAFPKTTNETTAVFQDTTMLFMGGLIIAVALEETGLHTRISLCVMMIVGAQPML
jgi:di/tricarboxylate transporter